MNEIKHPLLRHPRIKRLAAASSLAEPHEELQGEGEVFEQMGWRVRFCTLDGKAAVQIERPPELCRRDAWLQARLGRIKLWNEELNEPAPEVRAVMWARSLQKAGGGTEENRMNAREFLSHFAWESASSLDPWPLKRLVRAVEVVAKMELEERQLETVESLTECFRWLCCRLRRLPTKRELREDFNPDMDKGQFSKLLEAAMLSWLNEDHKAKGKRKG